MLTQWLQEHHSDILLNFINSEENDWPNLEGMLWEQFGFNQTIVFIDLSGFGSKCRKLGITAALHWIIKAETIVAQFTNSHCGQLIKSVGDSWMVAFDDSINALEFVIEYRNYMLTLYQHEANQLSIVPCFGIATGKVLRFGHHDMYGDPVNSASVLGEDLAKPWQVLLCEKVAKELNQRSVRLGYTRATGSEYNGLNVYELIFLSNV